MNVKVLRFIVSILLVGLGFLIGFKSVKVQDPKVVTTIKYVKGETIAGEVIVKSPPIIIKPDTLDILKFCLESGLYKELIPKDTVTLTIHDTVNLIINDWAAKKHYEQVLWNTDTLGMCNVKVDIQYNDLQSLTYNYYPVEKYTTIETTINKARLFQPMIGGGITTSNYFLLSAGGFFKEKYGIMATYQRPFTMSKDYTLALQALFLF